MDDFSLLQNAILDYEKTIGAKSTEKYITSEYECLHPILIDEYSSKICKECGIEVSSGLLYEKEWRYYGASNRRNSDPTRCQMRKVDERAIFKDLENMKFPEHIIIKANEIYLDSTQNKIYRGNTRKAIIFACVFHAFKLYGKPQSYDTLKDTFKIERKIVLKGLKYINLNASKDSEIRSVHITPVEIIKEIMEKYNSNEKQVSDVLELYEKIKNKTSLVRRGRPQSVAGAVVYYYICQTRNDISLKDFAKSVHLTELTINKMLNEIKELSSNWVI